MTSRLAFAAALALVACNYPERESALVERDQDRHAPSEIDCTAGLAEVCDGNQDEDCDGLYDCNDDDCFGVDECPTCGELDLVEGEPLALPDGDGNSYQTSIEITGFTSGQVSTDESDFVGVCVNMEHSWLRDLQIELTCPSGQTIVLQQFLGQTGGTIYMGQPNDFDGTDPVPGIGAEYCWTPTATNPPMLDWANLQASEFGVINLPPGDYQASGGFAPLVGCTLNGPWTIKVTDLWGADNGFIFSWGVRFEPAIIEDCDDWIE